MKRLSLTIITVLTTLIGFTQTPTFLSNFEDQNTDPEIGSAQIEYGTSGGMQVVPNPHPDAMNSSEYVLKVFTESGTGGRAEYSVPRHETNEKKYIYTWKRFHPVGMFTDVNISGWCSYNQWKTWPCEFYGRGDYSIYSEVICSGGGIFNDFKHDDDETAFYTSRAKPDCKTDYTDLPEGYWNSFVLEVYWTNTSNGYYRIWRNDTLFGYSDNMKTLFDEFLEGSCNIYWSNGLYTGWTKTGGGTTDLLTAYVDDIALYDIDDGFTISDICPECEGAEPVPTDSYTYRININGGTTSDGYNNSIISYTGDTTAIDLSSTYGQNNGIDVYLFSDALAVYHNTLTDDCFPEGVITTNASWTDSKTHKIYLKDLDPAKNYTFRLLGATSNIGANIGAEIWTTEENRDMVYASNNTCNVAELTNLVSDENGELTINVKAIDDASPRAFINGIEIIEYDLTFCDLVNFSATADITNTYSSDGSIDQTVISPQPVTHSWSNGETTEDITGLSPGNYTDTIIMVDSLCQLIKVYTVTQSNPCDTTSINVLGTVAPDTSSQGVGSIDVSETGGSEPYTHLWSNGETSQDISGLTVGTYVVTVTDQNGCTGSSSFIVSDSDPCSITNINIDGTVVPDTSSKGVGAIEVSETGGNEPYTYSWSNGQTTQDISGLFAGTYVLTVTDQNGCTGSNSFIVNNFDPCSITNITIEGSVAPDTSSKGVGAIDVSVLGGAEPYTYSWGTGQVSQDISGLTAGSYVVTVTDKNDCTSSQSFVVNDLDICSLTYIVISGTVTHDTLLKEVGSIDVSVSGNGSEPYAYSWSNGQATQDISGLAAGTYVVTVTDKNGCAGSKNFPVYNFDICSLTNIIVEGTVTPDSSSKGVGTIEITGTGGAEPYTYSWSSGQVAQNISGLSAGSYVVTVTDQNGCNGSNSFTVTNFDLCSITNISIEGMVTPDTSSNDLGSINIFVSGNGDAPFTYSWSNGQVTEDISGLSAGSYVVTVTDQNGCAGSKNFTVNNFDPCSITNIVINGLVTPDTLSKEVGSIDISISGNGDTPFTYLWSKGQVTEDISGLSAGSYVVTVTDQKGCTGSNSFSVNNFDPCSITNIVIDGLVTPDTLSKEVGSIDISISGNGDAPFTYSWSSGQVTEDISGLSAGTYVVTITDQKGCTGSNSFTVNNFDLCSITNIVIDGAVVHDTSSKGLGSISIIETTGGSEPYTYSWSNGEATQDISGLLAGVYSVTVADRNNCFSDMIYNVKNLTPEGLDPCDTTTLNIFGDVQNEIDNELNGSITLYNITGGTGSYTFLWNNGETTHIIENLSAGDYNVLVTDGNGCSGFGTFEVLRDETKKTSVSDYVNSKVVAYPNPVKDVLFINEEIELPEIFIYSLEGVLVKRVSEKYEVQVSDLRNGLYILLVKSNLDTYKSKISIQNN